MSILSVNETINRWYVEGLTPPADKTIEDLKAFLAAKEVEFELYYGEGDSLSISAISDPFKLPEIEAENVCPVSCLAEFTSSPFSFKWVTIEEDGYFNGMCCLISPDGNVWSATNIGYDFEGYPQKPNKTP